MLGEGGDRDSVGPPDLGAPLQIGFPGNSVDIELDGFRVLALGAIGRPLVCRPEQRVAEGDICKRITRYNLSEYAQGRVCGGARRCDVC